MKIALIVLISIGVLLSLLTGYFFILGQNSRNGNAPGLTKGLLNPCPDKPNCVCSDHPQDTAHTIEPIKIPGEDVAASMQKLQEIIAAQGGSVIKSDSTYIAATFTSSLFGFVDDLEFRADSDTNTINLRSASRVGTSDLGANRKRVDRIRQIFRGG